MRTINQNIGGTIAKLTELKGKSLTVKVNRGRNKVEMIEGVIENLYPSIFTIRKVGGGISTFSYNDILSNNITLSRGKSNI